MVRLADTPSVHDQLDYRPHRWDGTIPAEHEQAKAHWLRALCGRLAVGTRAVVLGRAEWSVLGDPDGRLYDARWIGDSYDYLCGLYPAEGPEEAREAARTAVRMAAPMLLKAVRLGLDMRRAQIRDRRDRTRENKVARQEAERRFGEASKSGLRFLGENLDLTTLREDDLG